MSLEIAVPELARNVRFDKDLSFYTLTLEYDIDIADVESQYDFYNSYFATLGWVNPYEQIARSKNTGQAGWSSYQMTFNKVENRPEMVYASYWKAEELEDLLFIGFG